MFSFSRTKVMLFFQKENEICYFLRFLCSWSIFLLDGDEHRLQDVS